MKYNNLIPLLLSVLIFGSMSVKANLNSATCNNDTLSYCKDCFSFVTCGTDEKAEKLIKFEEEIPHDDSIYTCIGGETCRENGNAAYCEISETQCTCPSISGVSATCDAYNSSLVIICFDGSFNGYAVCEEETMCISGYCLETTQPPPTGGMTEGPIPDCSSGEFEEYPKNCTSFYLCNDYQLYLEICNTTEFAHFDGIIIQCVKYEHFSCPTIGQGLYGDPYNCSLFYNCQDGNQIGPAQSCSDNQEFDEDAQLCVAESDCTNIRCTPCTDLNLKIAINCTSYDTCEKDKTGTYYTVITHCPEGLFFDPVKKTCSENVDGCP